MKIRETWFLAALAVLTAGWDGCQPQSNEEDDAAGDGTADPEDDLAERCATWQSAYCGTFAPCTGTTLADCTDRVDDVVCVADAPLDECSASLQQSSCASLPTDCDPSDVADVVAAYQQCEDFKAAYCERYVECNPGASASACRQEQGQVLDCHLAYAIEQPEYEQCLAALPAHPCGDTALPSACVGSIWIE